MKDYAENRKEHLAKYAKDHGIPVDGIYRGKMYKHIIKLDSSKKEEKIKKVEKYMLLQGITLKLLNGNLQSYAHHLNSSQILCYNFFRPLLNNDNDNDNDRTPKQELVDILKQNGITISGKAECHFEYTDKKDKKDNGRDKSTEFDFHIKDGNKEVFFEIKYTEDGFGPAKKDDNHKDKFDKVYKGMGGECKCLENNNLEWDDFRKYYQIYRNVLRITDENKYVIFITAEKNAKTKKQLEEFICKKIKEDYKKNVISLHWEDLIKEGHPLYEMYIKP